MDPRTRQHRRQGLQQLGGGWNAQRQRPAPAGQRSPSRPERTGHLVFRAAAGTRCERAQGHGRHGRHAARHTLRGAGPHARGGLGFHQHRARCAGPVPGADQPRESGAIPRAGGAGQCLGRLRVPGGNHPGQGAGGCAAHRAPHAPWPGDQRCAGPHPGADRHRALRPGAALDRARCGQPQRTGHTGFEPRGFRGRSAGGLPRFPRTHAERRCGRSQRTHRLQGGGQGSPAPAGQRHPRYRARAGLGGALRLGGLAALRADAAGRWQQGLDRDRQPAHPRPGLPALSHPGLGRALPPGTHRDLAGADTEARPGQFPGHARRPAIGRHLAATAVPAEDRVHPPAGRCGAGHPERF